MTPLRILYTLLRRIEAIRNTGAGDIEKEEELRRIRLVNSLSMAIVCLILGIGALFYVMTGRLSILIPSIVEFFLALSPIMLNRRRKYVQAASITFLTQCIASLYFGLLLGNVLELQAVVFFLLLITFLLFDRGRLRRICFVVALVILVVLEANAMTGFVPPLTLNGPSANIFKALSFSGLFCLILIVGAPYIRSHDTSFELKRSLKDEEHRNYEKTIFIRDVSHEIQGSFLGIIKMAQSLRAGIAGQEQDTGAVADQLIDACRTYKNMLANLLEYTRIDAGVLESVYKSHLDIRAYAEKIIRINTYAAADKRVRIHLDVSDEVPSLLWTDELRLTQIFNNLLTNAIKFTPDGSNIYVSIGIEGRRWLLSVLDEGPGVPVDRQKRVFDLFVTDRDSESNREGMGLGLFITRHLVEDLLQGTITVSNRPPQGAHFQVMLPSEVT